MPVARMKVLESERCFLQHHDEVELKCPLCKVVTIFDTHACRVCERTFHHACLEKRGFYAEGELDAVTKFEYTDKGWSCFECHTLSRLLSADDVDAMYEEFDKCNINKGKW
ncbi:hypothetical protein LSAT2_023738 [Lamellibrachia satsuma]|nr:hypothetical protein LSAT2_023738 [Lamellibrachia satsuma]